MNDTPANTGKFSGITLQTKMNMRQLRLNAGHSMSAGARLVGISRKRLEDLETNKNYGSHVDLELLAVYSRVYDVSIDQIVGDLPHPQMQPDYFQRPRVQGGERQRQQRA